MVDWYSSQLTNIPKKGDGYLREEMTFGEYLRSLIKNKGYTFAAFREKIGLSKTYLVDIEKGNTYPTPDMQIRMADILDLGDAERQIFFDKAAIGRREIPADVFKYLLCNPNEILIIRERMREYV